jgi:hypothetical protein
VVTFAAAPTCPLHTRLCGQLVIAIAREAGQQRLLPPRLSVEHC